jgi:hypothetical protein
MDERTFTKNADNDSTNVICRKADKNSFFFWNKKVVLMAR